MKSVWCWFKVLVSVDQGSASFHYFNVPVSIKTSDVLASFDYFKVLSPSNLIRLKFLVVSFDSFKVIASFQAFKVLFPSIFIRFSLFKIPLSL